MIKKKHVLTLVFSFLFLNIIFLSVNAQQETTRHVDVNISRPGPEFIVHWRYSDFPNNARADTVVNMVETAVRNAWEKIIDEWHFNEPPDEDGIISIYINDGTHAWGPISSYVGTFWGPRCDDEPADRKNDTIYIQHNIQQYMEDNFSVEWPEPEQNVFDIAIVHEFFHAVQRSYNVVEIPKRWFAESTARFIESVVDPSAVFYENQNAGKKSLYINGSLDYLLSPEKKLVRDGHLMYSPCILWRYVYEHHGGINTIKSIFEGMGKVNPQDYGNDLDKIFEAIINAVSNALPVTAKDNFIDFAKANYLKWSNI